MDTLIEQRLAAVELAVSELQRRLILQASPTAGLRRFDGAFKDEPAFRVKRDQSVRQVFKDLLDP